MNTCPAMCAKYLYNKYNTSDDWLCLKQQCPNEVTSSNKNEWMNEWEVSFSWCFKLCKRT